MRKICVHNINDGLNYGDAVFDPDWLSSFHLGNDYGFYFPILREKLLKNGFDIHTHDMVDMDEFDAFLFFDMPQKDDPVFLSAVKSNKDMYLIITECWLIEPRNGDSSLYKNFKKIFTWNLELCSDKFVRCFWPNRLNVCKKTKPFSQREKLCVLVAGNKKNKDQKELYSERRAILDWFASFHSDEMDLYGPGWRLSGFAKAKESIRNVKRYIVGERTKRIKNYPFYKGLAGSKSEALSRYSFCICYENLRDVPGYITEKIFDCFSAGVVPVYKGWSGVKEYIPQATFIDGEAFADYEDLYQYMRSMDEKTYTDYLQAAREFLMSPASNIFSGDSFVDCIVSQIIESS